MRKTYFHATFAALLVLILGTILSVASQSKKSSDVVLDFSNLTFTLATTDKSFVRQEPIPIVLSISNKKTKPVLGHMAITFDSPHLRLFVQGPTGERKRVENLSLVRAIVAVEPQEIKPGEQHQVKEALTLNLDHLFPVSGKYQIQAVLTGFPGEIESNILTVSIADPQSLDLEAYSYITGKGEYAFLFSGGDLSDTSKARRDLEEFLSLYEQSAYGDYATFLLGKKYLAVEEFELAKQRLNKVANKPNFAFADEAKDFIDKIKKKLSDLPSSQ